MDHKSPASGSSDLMKRLVRLIAEIVVGIYLILDGLIAPLFRPLMRYLSSLRVIQRIERGIASLPPYVILVLLGVPFAIAELAKVYAVLLMGTGHLMTGLAIFIGAYVMSILVCERILHAGKPQLLKIGWFAKGYGWIMAYKDKALAWFRETAVWKMAADLREKARLAKKRVAVWLNGIFPGKTGRLPGR